MKTPEVTLTEWTSDTIKFDFGRGSRTLTREQFTVMCDYLKTDVPLGDHCIHVICENGDKWEVRIESFVDEVMLRDTHTNLERYSKRGQFRPQIAVQFQTLDEISRWAKGELDGKSAVPYQQVPPPDSWMRPVPR